MKISDFIRAEIHHSPMGKVVQITDDGGNAITLTEYELEGLVKYVGKKHDRIEDIRWAQIDFFEKALL